MYLISCDASIEPFQPDGIMAWAFIVKAIPGGEIHRAAGISGWGKGSTNNQAEYHAVIAAMLWLLQLEEKDQRTAIIQSDSQLVINQCSAQWGVHEPTLQILNGMVLEARQRYPKNVTFKWIPREKNKEADAHSRSVYTEEMLQIMRDNQLQITFGDDDVPW